MKKPTKIKIDRLEIIKSIRRPLPPPGKEIVSKKIKEERQPKHKRRIGNEGSGADPD